MGAGLGKDPESGNITRDGLPVARFLCLRLAFSPGSLVNNPNRDPIAMYLDYQQWATRRLIDMCRPLDNDALDREFSIGPGSLRVALNHIISCMERWHARSNGQSDFPPPGEPPTLDELSARLDAVIDALRGFAEHEAKQDWSEAIATDFKMEDGSMMTLAFSKLAALMHCLNHATHHRSQCLNMLRQLGVTEQPYTDLIDWEYETKQIEQPEGASFK